MTDTPQHVKDLQLRLWLSQTPAERLQRLMIDNDAMFDFWAAIKPVSKTNLVSGNKNKLFLQ